ncbi:uncharacterized protein LOC119659019 [Hermetia illucens]|uniref:uncharacterized protein LOC119659019 n=1 Tax=Hermetia illucens TaxID=343691 RepID=UPI0018CC4D55|nr:uncharacterized protein LOC119659019 [Hermetia illucens]
MSSMSYEFEEYCTAGTSCLLLLTVINRLLACIDLDHLVASFWVVADKLIRIRDKSTLNGVSVLINILGELLKVNRVNECIEDRVSLNFEGTKASKRHHLKFTPKKGIAK